MSAAQIQALSEVVLAAVAIVGAIASAFTAAYKVGQLTGTLRAFMSATTEAQQRTRTEVDRLSQRLTRHIEHASRKTES